MPAMSVNEMRCFKAAMRFQRQEILLDLLRSLYPKLPFIDRVRHLGMVPRLLYSVLILATVPLLSLLWLIYVAFQLLALPYRFYPYRLIREGSEGREKEIFKAFTMHFPNTWICRQPVTSTASTSGLAFFMATGLWIENEWKIIWAKSN